MSFLGGMMSLPVWSHVLSGGPPPQGKEGRGSTSRGGGGGGSGTSLLVLAFWHKWPSATGLLAYLPGNEVARRKYFQSTIHSVHVGSLVTIVMMHWTSPYRDPKLYSPRHITSLYRLPLPCTTLWGRIL